MYSVRKGTKPFRHCSSLEYNQTKVYLTSPNPHKCNHMPSPSLKMAFSIQYAENASSCLHPLQNSLK